ncbi:MAG: hypothetical protein ACHQRK_09900 [Gemmatimonadales bacterium]|jgi:hypothetical protein
MLCVAACARAGDGTPDSARAAPKTEQTAFVEADSQRSDADTSADPVRVVSDYYAAISARDFARAYLLWSDDGRASGKTLDEFARGFEQMASVVATVGDAGRIEGAAGSRFVEVPVEIRSHQRDGIIQRFRGHYTLRRTVVTGATDAQRRWHLYSAAIALVR